MQLNGKPGAMRLGLMAAACSLLAPVAPAQDASTQAADDDGSLKLDAGLLYYGENGGRIKSYDAIVDLRADYGDEHVLSGHVSFDSLSGGSPNGAVPTRAAQTFATPSGTSLQATTGTGPATYTTASGRTVAQLSKVTLYTTAAGALPLDPNFKDTREAVDLNWSQPLGQDNHGSIGGHFSHENDFSSASGSLSFSRDFNSKNTTVGLGLNIEYDQVKPVGGAPIEGTDYTLLQKNGDRKKQVKGVQLGVTQVLSRNWITQLNLSADKSTGYLTDPYKIVSVLDSVGAVKGYVFERRPEDRTRRSIYWGNKVALGESVLDVSYRHGFDSWSIRTDTVDARYRFTVGSPDVYIEPHLRWYKQSKADFYSLYLDGTSHMPAYASADPRLAAFTGKTIGVKVGLLLVNEQELTFRLEGYQQDPSVRSSSLAGLSGLDLNPGLKSVLFQVNYRFGY
jgi:hypothetical protein